MGLTISIANSIGSTSSGGGSVSHTDGFMMELSDDYLETEVGNYYLQQEI